MAARWTPCVCAMRAVGAKGRFEGAVVMEVKRDG